MSAAKPLDISIIDFFESDAILGIKTLSATQKVILKVINGETLNTFFRLPKEHDLQERDFENEVDLFLYLTGKKEYVPGHRYSDMSLAAGRRGGKSNIIGAGLACYYATQKDFSEYLGTSPAATIAIVSPTKAQASEVYQAIKTMFLRSPYLYEVFLDGTIDEYEEEYDEKGTPKKVFTGGQIKLNNKVVIKVLSADVSKVRGYAIPFYILDECCWFGTESGDQKNTDEGIFQAIQPATAQFGDLAFGIKISSPNGEVGLMYNDYTNRNEEDTLHFQAPTWYMNPRITMAYLNKQRKKGDHYYNREYGAEYTSSENSYLDPKLVELCQISGIDKFDYNNEYRYVAAMDYATKNDYWTFAVGHKEYNFRDVMINGKLEKEKYHVVVCDLLMHWKGSQGAELDPKSVIEEISVHLHSYRIGAIVADQYAFAAVKNLFEQHSMNTIEFKASLQSKKKYMYSLQVAVNSGTLKFVNSPLAVKHLKDLREKRTSNAQVKIEAATGSHDDYASSIGLVVYQFDSSSPIYIGVTKDDEEPVGPPTKDLEGRALSLPSFNDLAEMLGNPMINANLERRKELEKDLLKKNKGNPEPAVNNPEGDDDAFWFIV